MEFGCFIVSRFYLGDSDGELLYRLCGHTAPNEKLLIASPQIWIQFLSNGQHTDKGFLIRYSSLGKMKITFIVCGNPSGIHWALKSLKLHGTAYCRWSVECSCPQISVLGSGYLNACLLLHLHFLHCPILWSKMDNNHGKE